MHVVEVLDQNDRTRRQLSERADHLGMPGMTDEDHSVPAAVMQLGLPMDLGDQGTRGIDREHLALGRLAGDRLRYAVG